MLQGYDEPQSLTPLTVIASHPQAFSHPVSNHAHPVERLAREVQQLKDKLAQVASSTTGSPPATRSDTNLNKNTNNGTFLFPAQRPQGLAGPRAAPTLTSTSNHQTSRGRPPSSASPSAPAHRDCSSSNKQSFLFGDMSAREQQQQQLHYYAATSNAKLAKGSSFSKTS